MAPRRSDIRMLWGGVALLFLVGCVLLQTSIDPDRRWFKPEGSTKASPKELAQIPRELFGGALMGFREVAAGLLWVRADDYYHSGRYDDIVPLFYIVTWLDPHQLDVFATGAWHLMFNLGDQRLIPEGIKFLKEGIRQNANVWDLYFQLAFLGAQKTRNFADAAYWARQALKHPGTDGLPAPFYVKNELAQFLEKNGQIEEMRRQREENVVEAVTIMQWPKVLSLIRNPQLKSLLQTTSPVQVNSGWLDLAVPNAAVAARLSQPALRSQVENAVSSALVEGICSMMDVSPPSMADAQRAFSSPDQLRPRLHPVVWKKVPALRTPDELAVEVSTRWQRLEVARLRLDSIRKGAGQPGYIFDNTLTVPRWVYIGDGKRHQQDLNFDFRVERVGPKKIKVIGHIDLPNFSRNRNVTYCRLLVRLRDKDYDKRYAAHANDWDWQRDNLTLREKADFPFPMDPEHPDSKKFEYELDLSKDPEDLGHPPEKLFPFKAPEYEVTVMFDPIQLDQSEFSKDFFGYKGEGITDKHYLVVDPKTGIRRVEKTIILRREDIV